MADRERFDDLYTTSVVDRIYVSFIDEDLPEMFDQWLDNNEDWINPFVKIVKKTRMAYPDILDVDGHQTSWMSWLAYRFVLQLNITAERRFDILYVHRFKTPKNSHYFDMYDRLLEDIQK